MSSFDVEKEVRKAFPCQCEPGWAGDGKPQPGCEPHRMHNACCWWDEIVDVVNRARADAVEATERECINLTCTKCRADAPPYRKEFSWGPHWFHEGNPCCAELIHERRRRREEG